MSDDREEMKIVDLAKEREKSDCMVWSARDCLVDMIAQIDRGDSNPVKLIIVYCEEAPEGGLIIHWQRARVKHLEHLGLLHAAASGFEELELKGQETD